MKMLIEFPRGAFADEHEMSQFVQCAMHTEAVLRTGEDIEDIRYNSGHSLGAIEREKRKKDKRRCPLRTCPLKEVVQ